MLNKGKTSINLNDEFDDLYKILKKSFELSEIIPEMLNEYNKDTYELSFIMLNRLQEQINSTFKLFISGDWASFETLCRICIEYSIRTSYLLQKENKERFAQYISTYFNDMENKQNKTSFINISTSYKLIENSKKNIQLRKVIIKEYCNRIGINIDKKYPKLTMRNMCDSLGENVIYETAYSKLSSIVHGDADALIDLIIIECLPRSNELKKLAYNEEYEWLVNDLILIIKLYFSTYETYFKTYSKNIDNITVLINEAINCLKIHSEKLTLLNKLYSK